jgi:hypothetical protein
MRLAADHLLSGLEDGTVPLSWALQRADLHEASDDLEGTYLIFLFAQFERALRRFLRDKNIKIPRHAKQVINRVATRIQIAGDILTNTHKVRDHRNRLVHHLEGEVELLTIRDAPELQGPSSFSCRESGGDGHILYRWNSRPGRAHRGLSPSEE